MLIVTENDVFQVPIYFTEKEGQLTFYSKADAPSEAKTETFTFRRPNWADSKLISSTAIVIDAATGKPTLDLYRYMDQKIKTLLKDWTLKNGTEKLNITAANINKLNPDLVQNLYAKMEEVLNNVKS